MGVAGGEGRELGRAATWRRGPALRVFSRGGAEISAPVSAGSPGAPCAPPVRARPPRELAHDPPGGAPSGGRPPGAGYFFPRAADDHITEFPPDGYYLIVKVYGGGTGTGI